MTKEEILQEIEKLNSFDISQMYGKDFILTWEKSIEELIGLLKTAQILKTMRDKNYSLRIFDSGLGVSIFRDNSTRTRFSFASACDLLGLGFSDLDEKRSQVAHGETVRETANMISFLTEVIGIRDDIYLGEGNTYIREVASAVSRGYADGILPGRPAIVNLQCDIDHPTQSLADLLHVVNHFGGIENLKGKKIAMTWAYSPSYGKPLSVPQGIIGLFSRFGMEVALAHPEGYNLLPEVEVVASDNARISGGSYSRTNSMAEAFKDADLIYPKSWAPFSVMERRTELLKKRDTKGLEELEKECLENNRKFASWEATEEMLSLTNKALYMHCLPADITGVSCKQGEVSASVFERFRNDTYREASYKPYIIAAMIFLSKMKDPVKALNRLASKKKKRIL